MQTLLLRICLLIMVCAGASRGAKPSLQSPSTLEKGTAPKVIKTEPMIARLYTCNDRFEALQILGDLEKMIPGDPRLPGLRKRANGLPFPKKTTLDLGAGVKMEFILIQPGSFLMGSDKGVADEKPVHKVTITKAFYLGKYEVTQEQWQAVMASNPSEYKDPKNPVEQVSWNDCRIFIAKLKIKVQELMPNLPTEAQWEYACRAGSTTAYGFGEDDRRLGEYAWYVSNAADKPHPVGQKKPNAWGLYDMHGNVWEWCRDWKGEYAKSEATDPTGPKSGEARVLRGGAWGSDPNYCRAAYRDTFIAPAFHFHNLGFRLALNFR